MKAVMMVAGKSTRTYPLTLTRPKPLLPVLNRPLIYYNLDQLVGLVSEVVLIVGYRKEMISKMLGEEYKGMKITYQEQKEQLGTGHAVLQAEPHIQEPFIVMNGDDLFAKEDVKNLLSFNFAALALSVPNPSLYGVFHVNEKNQVIKLVEKPKEYIGNLANVGCYLFQPRIFSVLEKLPPSERGEIEVTSAIQEIAEQEPVQVVPISQYWLPTGFPWDLLKTQNYLFKNNFIDCNEGIIEDQVKLQGKIKIGKRTVIKSGSNIQGPVCIGENCEIGETSSIGPNTSIGSNVKIGPNCQIDNSILMEDCSFGYETKISHSVLGYQVNLGDACHLISNNPENKSIQSLVKGKWIDTQLTNLGATLSDNVTLGASSYVYPGCKIWPGKTLSKGSTVQEDIC